MTNYSDMTEADFRELAARIRYLADGYEAVAARMREKGHETITAGGIDTVQNVLIRRIQGNLGQVQNALIVAASTPDKKQPLAIEESSGHLSDQAKAARERLASRKKKKQ